MQWLKLIFALIFTQTLLAQPNCFYAVGYPPADSQVKICVGVPITMNDANCTDFDPNPALRFYKFEPSLSFTNNKTHTYTQAGTYTVEFRGNVNPIGGVTIARTNYVQVLPTPKPKITFKRCAGRQIQIQITDFAPYNRYKVDLGNSVVQYITPSTNPFIYTYPVLGTYNIKVEGEHEILPAVYCSGVNRDTTLQNVTIFDNLSTLASAFSITQIGLASTCEGKYKISAPQILADIRYEIALSRNGQAFEILKTIEKENINNFEFMVENLNNLGQSHTFKITLTDLCGNTNTPVFMQTFLATLTLPLKVQGVNASFNLQNQLQISWKDTQQAQDELRTYQVLENGTILDKTQNSQLIFEGKDKIPSCYTIENTSTCNVKTLFSEPACPMILQVSSLNLYERKLEWTPYRNSENEQVIEYQVIKLNSIGGAIDNFVAGTATNFLENKEDLENQVIQYRVKAITASGEYFSNVVRVERPVQVFFPNVFTPNGDGLNDIFFPKGLFIKSIEIAIFNQNGQQLFASTALGEGWDGTFAGKPQPAGVYIYTCQVQDLIGNRKTFSGTFILQK